jgi:hypothetical protein
MPQHGVNSTLLWRERHRDGIPIRLELTCCSPIVGILGSLERPHNEIWRILGRSAEHDKPHGGTTRPVSTAIIAA